MKKTRQEQLADRAAYMRKWNKEHPHWKADRRKRVEVRIKAVEAMKESAPCTDCGLFYPHFLMQYDHLRDKRMAVSHLVRKGVVMDKILSEIAKCDLVCAHCHITRTHCRRYGLPLPERVTINKE